MKAFLLLYTASYLMRHKSDSTTQAEARRKPQLKRATGTVKVWLRKQRRHVEVMSLCIIALFSVNLNAQTVQSSCSTSDTIRFRYRIDAKRLALRQTIVTSSTFKDSIRIDRSLVNKYYQALLAVYNATNTPLGDTLVKVYPVRTNLSPEMFQVNVFATGTLSWMQSLFNSQVPTGNSQIDALLSKYNLFPIAYYSGTPDMVIL